MARRRRSTKGRRIAKGRKVADYIRKHNFTDTTNEQFKEKILATMIANEKTSQGKKRKSDARADRKISEFSVNDAKRAVEKLRNSEEYTSAAERSRYNMKEAMKNYDGAWDEYKRLSRRRVNGRFVKQEWTWNTEHNGYTFIGSDGFTYLIDVTNSPEEITITSLGVNV